MRTEEREPVSRGPGPRREPELGPARAQHGEEGARHDAAEMGREAHARVRHPLDERAHDEAEEEEEDAVPEEAAPPLHERPVAQRERSVAAPPAAPPWHLPALHSSSPPCPPSRSSPPAFACP